MDKIIKATPLSEYQVQVESSSGVTGIFDVRPYLNGSAFQELKDNTYFNQVYPAHHGIRWPNGQDFSSDTILHDIQTGG